MSDLFIHDYSERSIAVFGSDTKTHKDTLKELGGKFNPALTDPKNPESKAAGWIFSKSKLEQVKSFIESLTTSIVQAKPSYAAKSTSTRLTSKAIQQNEDLHNKRESSIESTHSHTSSGMSSSELNQLNMAMLVTTMIERTRISTIMSKKANGETVVFKTFRNNKVTVTVSKGVYTARWKNGDIAIFIPHYEGNALYILPPFVSSGLTSDTTMEYFICLIETTNLTTGNIFGEMVDGKLRVFAFADDDCFDNVIEQLGINWEKTDNQ